MRDACRLPVFTSTHPPRVPPTLLPSYRLSGDIFPAVNPPRQRDPGFEATIKVGGTWVGL